MLESLWIFFALLFTSFIPGTFLTTSDIQLKQCKKYQVELCGEGRDILIETCYDEVLEKCFKKNQNSETISLIDLAIANIKTIVSLIGFLLLLYIIPTMIMETSSNKS